MLNIDLTGQIQLEANDLVGRSVAVLGITGSGKTNTAAVLIEELLAAGIPLCIIDIEGEYWGLKEKFEVLVAGRGENADVQAGIEQAAVLAEFSVAQGISIVLDLSEFGEEERFEFLLPYLESLWKNCSARKQPYVLVLEEAHEFIPQGPRTPLKTMLTRIALRGRKRGLGIVMMSQRSAKVDKDVLTQAQIFFLHQVIHPIDLKVYQEIIPLPARDVEKMVGSLQPGQAIVLFRHQATVAQIRLRHTFHPGATPLLDQAVAPSLKKIDTTLLAELNKLVASKPKAETEAGGDNLARRVKELEKALAESQTEVARLKEQLELVSRLKPTVEGLPSNTPLVNPQTLNIDQAIVRQLISGDGQSVSLKPVNHEVQLTTVPATAITNRTGAPVALPSPVPAAVVNTDNNNKKVTPKLRSELTLGEKRTLKRITGKLQTIGRQRRSHLAVLDYLERQGGKQVLLVDVARGLGYEFSGLLNNQPVPLVKMGLLTRSGRGAEVSYRSNLEQFVKENFPGLDPKIVKASIISSL